MKIIYKDNFNLFKSIIAESQMMQDESNRSLLALLMINKSIYASCIRARKTIPVILSKADVVFTNTVFVYDKIMKIALNEIINTMLESKNIDELYNRLSPLGRAVIYSQVSAAIAYYQATIISIAWDMVPGADYKILVCGFAKLRDLRRGMEERFRPRKAVQSRLMYMLPRMAMFQGNDKMLWYLCYSDLEWSKAMIKGIKSSDGVRTIRTVVSLIEFVTQGFFDEYVSGIEKLSNDKQLTTSEYIILSMCFENDVVEYEELPYYYHECGILSQEFYDHFTVFNQNMAYVKDRLKCRVQNCL